MISRRAFLGTTFGAIIALDTVSAQATTKKPRVLFLSTGPVVETFAHFTQNVTRLGWRIGETIEIERRDAGGNPETLAQIARQLQGEHFDLVVTATMDVAKAVQPAGVPTVGALLVDPVGVGLIRSFARPGGNVTGITYDAGVETVGKRLQLLREMRPAAKRVAAIANLTLPGMPGAVAEYEATARAMGLVAVTIGVDRPAAIPSALEKTRDFRPDLLFVGGGFPAPAEVRRRLVDLAAELRVPALYSSRGYVVDGGLLYYGPDLDALYGRVAFQVDRVLKGTKPADLPVEVPTKFQMVVNARTARQLGVTLAPSILLSADEVIR